MKVRRILVFALIALFVAACAPVPAPAPLPASQATTAQATAPASNATAAQPAAPSPMPAAPPAVVTPAVIPAGWQVYTNPMGFAISYPATWTSQVQPSDSSNSGIETDALKGPEGEVDLSWGVGFGGACPSGYATVKVAQGDIQTCYQKNADGTESWTQMSHPLPTTGFQGRASTSNAQPASHDMVLQILSTLTFAPTPAATQPARGAAATPTATPAAATLRPLNPAECSAMADGMAKTLGVKVTTGEAPISDWTTQQSGTGCQATATGTGEQFKSPDAVMKSLGDMLVSMGWTEDMKLQAGGPTGMGDGYRKDGEMCLTSAGWRPSADANCPKDQPISACNVTPAQQQYTVTLNCAQ